jgi:hypothetical protein
LPYTPDFPLAVVEAKASYKTATDAVQQARTYAEMLGLKVAYAINGTDIIEIDYFAVTETLVPDFAKPEDLWRRYQTGSGIIAPQQAAQLIDPYPPFRIASLTSHSLCGSNLLPAGCAPPREVPVVPLHTVPLCTCLRCPTETHHHDRAEPPWSFTCPWNQNAAVA